MQTIGGGTVLDVHPERHRRFDATVIDHLTTAAHGGPVDKARMLVANAGLTGISLDTLRDLLALEVKDVEAALAEVRPVTTATGKVIDRRAYAELSRAILDEIAQYHETHPNRQGIAASKLRSMLRIETAEDVFHHAIHQLVSEARIKIHGGNVHQAGFDPLAELTQRERRVAAEMEEAFRVRKLLWARTRPGEIFSSCCVRRIGS